ncbi:MAG: polymerase, sigma-24 subunit, subfamily [Verrucomicrobiales bacterium]|nr:polymerase, sigma-24 subunit, subfamily [Verrucomicrobiales bacterium]
MNKATELLGHIQPGNPQASEELLALIYEELRKLAAYKMAHEAPGQTLQPTALVHEAWLRLMQTRDAKFENRAHFFSAAAEAMRRILIERARRKNRQRHGAGSKRVDFEEVDLVAPAPDEEMLALHEALDKLSLRFPRQGELVKLRYFAGLTNEEAAEILGISVATAKNDWTFARTWLFQEIKASSSS